jgi:hypothetical protein
MKKILSLLLMAAAVNANAQHKLDKLWATDTIVAIPESVLPDLKKNTLYVSLIDGGGWVVDGKGGVGKLSTDGKHYDSTWITGLNAPKGLGMMNNRLYADSRTAKIWRIENDKPALYLDSMKGVNGLKAISGDLLIGAGKNFIRADKNKNITKIADLPQAIDGIEPVGNGDYLVTSWGGYIYYVAANGQIETLLETYKEKKNTADIGYDPVNRIVYVPTFNGKQVVAYKLN